jgi:hypothetical protein
LRCASSIAHSGRVARGIALTGSENCIAFPWRIPNGVAEGETHAKESDA